MLFLRRSAGGPNNGLKGIVDPIGLPHAALLSMKEIDTRRSYFATVCTYLLCFDKEDEEEEKKKKIRNKEEDG